MAVGSFLKSSGIAALALAVALPATAFAQGFGTVDGAQAQQQQNGGQEGRWQGRGGDGNRNRGGGEARSQQQQAQAQPQAQPQAQSRWQGNRDGNGNGGRWQQQQGNTRPNVQPNAQRQGWNGQNRGDMQRNDGRRWDNDRNQARGGNRWNGNNNSQRWNNNWRRDNRYDWSGYRSSNRNVFRMGRYDAPYRGWSYRRLGIGFTLQPLFYSSSYWINDPSYYRLPDAYGPYRWVRYYDDALLVDIYSGEVVDVINSFFW